MSFKNFQKNIEKILKKILILKKLEKFYSNPSIVLYIFRLFAIFLLIIPVLGILFFVYESKDLINDFNSGALGNLEYALIAINVLVILFFLFASICLFLKLHEIDKILKLSKKGGARVEVKIKDIKEKKIRSLVYRIFIVKVETQPGIESEFYIPVKKKEKAPIVGDKIKVIYDAADPSFAIPDAQKT